MNKKTKEAIIEEVYEVLRNNGLTFKEALDVLRTASSTLVSRINKAILPQSTQ